MVFIGKFKHISYHAVPRTFFVYIKLIIFAKRGTVLFPHLYPKHHFISKCTHSTLWILKWCIVLDEFAIKQGKQSFFQQVIPFCLERTLSRRRHRRRTHIKYTHWCALWLTDREMCVVECVLRLQCVFTQGLHSLESYQRTTAPFVWALAWFSPSQ